MSSFETYNGDLNMRALTLDEVGFVSGGIKNPFINPARPNEAPTAEERAWQTIELFEVARFVRTGQPFL
jgi:hypothetical protein